MNANRIITLTTDAGRNDVITTAGVSQPYSIHSSVLRFSGASYFEIDGSNNGTDSRNITISLPAAANIAGNNVKVMDITGGDLPTTHIVIKNCTIIGNATGSTAINTYAGIYMGGTIATPSAPNISGNNHNRF